MFVYEITWSGAAFKMLVLASNEAEARRCAESANAEREEERRFGDITGVRCKHNRPGLISFGV